jgi:hypothetical protein
MFGCTYMPTIVGNLVVAVECLILADSASSTKAPEADIREDWDEHTNDRKGRSAVVQRKVRTTHPQTDSLS